MDRRSFIAALTGLIAATATEPAKVVAEFIEPLKAVPLDTPLDLNQIWFEIVGVGRFPLVSATVFREMIERSLFGDNIYGYVPGAIHLDIVFDLETCQKIDQVHDMSQTHDMVIQVAPGHQYSFKGCFKSLMPAVSTEGLVRADAQISLLGGMNAQDASRPQRPRCRLQ
jgi:hypothetical protein